MTVSALRTLCLALSLAATACFSPLLEVGSQGTLAVAPTGSPAVGGGFRNSFAVGAVPKAGWGPALRIEGLTGFDTTRGSLAAIRLFGGVAYTAAPPHHLSWEVGADAGARLDGGFGEHDAEAGVRGALVYSLGEPRTLFERNSAFVILGSGIDIVPSLRVGYAWNRQGPNLLEINPGLTMRFRIWTDIL